MINVGIDYDEPYYPWYDYAHDASVAAGLTTADEEPPTRWDPHSHYGCTWEEWVEVLDSEVRKGDEGMYMRPPKEESKVAVHRLYTQGYGVHFVTARGQFGTYGESIKRITNRQLLREGTPYNTLTFTQKKGETVKRLNLHYFVDDRPEYFEQASDAGAFVYLLDERWNQDFKVPEDQRVYSLTEAVDKIIEKHGNLRQLTPRQRSAVDKEVYSAR